MDAVPARSRTERGPLNNQPSSPLSTPPSSPFEDLLPASPLSSPPTGFWDEQLPDGDDLDPIAEAEGNNPRVSATRRQYTLRAETRHSTAQKLEKVLSVLREVHWTFPQFICAWVGAGKEARARNIDIESHHYRTERQRRSAL